MSDASDPVPGLAPEKPREGEPCNGCGFCCALEPCAIAKRWIGASAAGPCPAMEFEGERFWCGMVRHPSRYMGLPNDWADRHLGAMVSDALGVDRGCCASDP